MLRGLMMDTPLLISSLITYAAQYKSDAEIVSRTVEGPIHRYTFGIVTRRGLSPYNRRQNAPQGRECREEPPRCCAA